MKGLNTAGLCVRQPPADRCGPQQAGYPGEHRPGDWPPGNAVSDGRIGNWHQRSAGAGATVTAGEPSDGETADSGDGAAADAGMQENRSLSTAAQALWEIVREEGENLTAARVEDPLYQR